MAEPLRIVDPETGELVIPGCKACHELSARLAGLQEDLRNQQDENTRMLSSMKAMKRRRDEERLRHRRRGEIEAIFRDWQEATGKHKMILSADRFDVIVARLNEGYTAEHFHLAAYGAVHNNPWTPKAGQQPMIEIATFAKKGTWLEQFANAGYAAKRAA